MTDKIPNPAAELEPDFTWKCWCGRLIADAYASRNSRAPLKGSGCGGCEYLIVYDPYRSDAMPPNELVRCDPL